MKAQFSMKHNTGVEDGIDLDFLYPDSEAVAINFPQLRNSSSNSAQCRKMTCTARLLSSGHNLEYEKHYLRDK